MPGQESFRCAVVVQGFVVDGIGSLQHYETTAKGTEENIGSIKTIIMMIHALVWPKTYTVEPPIMDPPTRGPLLIRDTLHGTIVYF